MKVVSSSRSSAAPATSSRLADLRGVVKHGANRRLSKTNPRRKRKRKRIFANFTRSQSGDDSEDLDYSDSGSSSDDDNEIGEGSSSTTSSNTVHNPYDGEAMDYLEHYDADQDSNTPLRALRVSLEQRKRTTRSSQGAVRRRNVPQAADPIPAAVSTVDPDKSYILRLPIELLRMIVEDCLDFINWESMSSFEKQQVGHYSLVCKRFADILQPRLFEKLRRVKLRGLYQLSTILERSPVISSYVKELHLLVNCSVPEESNMVASAMMSTIPHMPNLHRLELDLTSPMGYQVMFPNLPHNFHAPSVRFLRVCTFKSPFQVSFVSFVSKFRSLECFYIDSLNFNKLALHENPHKTLCKSVKELILNGCSITQTIVELLPTILPNLETLVLASVDGDTKAFCLSLLKHTPSFKHLVIYNTTSAREPKQHSKPVFVLPLELWTYLSTVRIYQNANRESVVCPILLDNQVDLPDFSNLEKVELISSVHTFFIRSPLAQHLVNFARALNRNSNIAVPAFTAADRLNDPTQSLTNPPPILPNSNMRSFNIRISFKQASLPASQNIHDILDENSDYLYNIRKLSTPVLDSFQNKIFSGTWAVVDKSALNLFKNVTYS
ncbi:uncharacterized protein V1516DRAFT_677735 [Lipomyces oligophaga]|uniref:uncharacterized protein n=1 Tax=Lipomyces oligophaga TaxID=45792 RepID=UPI0034CEA313